MNQLFLTLSAICLMTTANAKVVAGKTQFAKIEVTSVVLEVEAKCLSPKFEDGSFTVYFSENSYAEVSAYEKQGYAYKLLGKTCGQFGASKELSSTDYETVQILMVNNSEAQGLLDEALKNAWNFAK